MESMKSPFVFRYYEKEKSPAGIATPANPCTILSHLIIQSLRLGSYDRKSLRIIKYLIQVPQVAYPPPPPSVTFGYLGHFVFASVAFLNQNFVGGSLGTLFLEKRPQMDVNSSRLCIFSTTKYSLTPSNSRELTRSMWVCIFAYKISYWPGFVRLRPRGHPLLPREQVQPAPGAYDLPHAEGALCPGERHGEGGRGCGRLNVESVITRPLSLHNF